MSNKKIYTLSVELFFLVLFGMGLIFSCANPLAPTGGPKDTLPPQVLAYTPEYGATNVETHGKRIRIDFDEYMVLKNQQTEFYVSPFTSIKPTVSMRGKGLYIEFLDTLKENQTYALNFGNSITDNNEGNVLYGFRYVFSTGDDIDSMLMSGYTVDAFTQDSVGNAFIMFYDADLDTLPDSDSLLLTTIPSMVARTQTYGGFIAENLKPIDYKVYAFEDKNHNQSYDPGVDKVGFIDSIYNPANMAGFNIWFDKSRGYMVSNPQIYFRLFTEKTFKRQYLSEVTRPKQHQVIIDFSAKDPVIESIRFDSIDMKDVIVEYFKSDKDSMALWLNVDSNLIPDTLRGEIISLKHDTLNVLQPDTQKLELVWTYFESRSKKELRALEEDSTLIENPFKFKVDVSSSVNPLKHIPITFDYPLIKLDTAQILLLRHGEQDKRYKVDFKLEQDTLNIRRWTIKANWQEEQNYSLTIPAGTFVNVARESNDTLKASFGVESKDEYASLVINVKDESEGDTYIMQLLDTKYKLVEERIVTGNSKQVFEYLKPQTLLLRFIKDDNKNGFWDTGVLVENKNSERVEMFFSKEGDLEIETKANWEVEFDVDLKDVFYELTTENINIYLNKKQRAEQRKKEKEELKKNPQYQTDSDSEEHNHEHDHDHE